MTEQHHARQAVLEAKVERIEQDLGNIQRDVREIRDNIVGARWAGRALLAVAVTLGALIGWLVRPNG